MTNATFEQLEEIDRRYGVRIGSIVRWNDKQPQGRSNAELRRKRANDGIGIVRELTWWGEAATPTARVEFPNRRQNPNFRASEGHDFDVDEVTKFRVIGVDAASTTNAPKAGDAG